MLLEAIATAIITVATAPNTVQQPVAPVASQGPHQQVQEMLAEQAKQQDEYLRKLGYRW